MSVTLHTTLGDLKIEVFCESVPKTAEAKSFAPCPITLHQTPSKLTLLHVELPRLMRVQLLRWLSLPPADARLHGPDRRTS